MGKKSIYEHEYQYALRQAQAISFSYTLPDFVCSVSSGISRILSNQFEQGDLLHIFLEEGLVHPNEQGLLLQFYRNLIIQTVKEQTAELRLKTVTGSYHWYQLTSAISAQDDYGNQRILGALVDINEQTRFRDSTHYLHKYDSVTGIFNKSTFFKMTEAMLSRYPDCPYRIIRFDIDHFKVVNDLFGITQGDRLLHYLGQLIKNRMCPNETYGRMRDDVFCMCVCRSDEDTIRLLTELDQAISSYPLDFKFVSSAGILRVDHYDGSPVNILCDRATLAQKTVKNNYVRRYAFYNDFLGKQLRQEQEIISETYHALEEKQFVVYLQPKYDILENTMFGAEALVRWQHPTKGVISPDSFIPLYETNGFITRLDEYVWEAVCQTLRSWLDRGYKPIPISVNVSRMHLYNPTFCEKLVELTAKYNLSPRLLELELTESAYISNPKALFEIMEHLQGRGFTFLMDDFGSGYSSLNMLKDIPVDILKIDLNFLRDSMHSQSGRIILESTIHMAQRLCLAVIAEGVETKEQANFLLGAGCTKAQGYYYSRPVPIEVFERRFYRDGSSPQQFLMDSIV